MRWDTGWAQQVTDLWAGEVDAPDLLDRTAAVAAACPTGDGSGLFELAGAHDSTGAFLALCLADVGRAHEALSLAAYAEEFAR